MRIARPDQRWTITISKEFNYSLDTTMFSNGTHSLSAIAETTNAGSVPSAPISFQINNLGQWRTGICPSGASSAEVWVVENNFTQSGIYLSANSTNTLVNAFGSLVTCPPYPLKENLPLEYGVAGTISGDTGSGSFLLSFNDPQRGALTISGICFDSSHLLPTSCVGPATGPFVGDHRDVTGQEMAPFSGTFSGTLSFPNFSSMTITATLVQSSNFALSVSYTDASGPHTLSGNVIGGSFELNTGFDGNQNTGIEACTGPLQAGFPSCSTFVIEVYDAHWNYAGTLQ
jgi:hypothetical protein